MLLRINYKETHHGYYGLILMGMAYLLSPYTPWVCCVSFSLLLYAIGAYLFLDDLYQHRRQVKEPEYHSPVHRAYSHIYKYKFIKSLNTFADDLFGGR